MTDLTLAPKRANDGPGGTGYRAGKGPGPRTPRGGRTAGLLPVAGTFVGTLALAYLLSPGLRSDLGGLVALLNLGTTGVTNWVLSFGTWAPVAYLLVMVAQVVASPIPAGPVALAGALVFGVWQGLAGSVVGSVLVFVAARLWGESLVARLVGEKVYRRYVGVLDDKGWWLFAILLFPLMPDDAVCALAGLSALSFRRFLFVMVVGRVPGSTTTALLASDWVTGTTVTWISAGVVAAAVLALTLVYRERLESWVLGGAGDGPPNARYAATSSEEGAPRGEGPR